LAISDGFEYTPITLDAIITNYYPTISSQGYNVTIPDTLDGYIVTKIDDNAFSNKSLSEITIDFAVDIGISSFSSNSGVSVTIDDDVTTDTLSSTDDPPFGGCDIGDNLTITSNVTTIDSYLMRNAGLTSVSFPTSVTEISEYSFENNSISSFQTWDELTLISDYAFSSNSMDSATFSHNVTLNKGCFRENSGLSIIVSAELSTTNIGILDQPPFKDSDLAGNVTITSAVIEIDKYLFKDAGLTAITLPNLTRLEDYCLADNADLDNVYVNYEFTIFETGVLDNSKSAVDPGTIHGFNGSSAEVYANSISNYNFTLLPGLGVFNVGQYVKIKIDGLTKFSGVINDCTYYRDNESNQLTQQISCSNMNSVPARRTIGVNYASNTSASEIVKDMVDDYLLQEGIERGEISDEIVFQEEWKNDVTNIAEVLDQCANRTGYQWFIDKYMKLNFYKNPTTVSECTYSLDTSTFEDFRNITVNENIDNYSNKIFVVGGDDDRGNLVFTISGDIDKQNEMQSKTAGTGTWGVINRDSAIVGHQYAFAGPGTSPTNVVWTAHSLQVGDFFRNHTRGINSIVTEVSANSFTCESVAGQTASDEVIRYTESNNIGKNMLSRQSEIPKKITFHSHAIEFEPGTKLTVDVNNMQLNGVYNIDEVNISERGACVWDTNVVAIKRIASDFNTQKNLDFTDYWRGF
jgi:cytochrome c2